MKFSHLGWTTNCLTKAPTHEKTFWVVGQDDPRDPQIITGHCFCAWVAPLEEAKSLLLKKSCILNAESRGPELDLNWTRPPWRLAFIYHKAPWKFPKKRKQPIVLSLCDAYEHQQWQAWHDNSKNPVGDTHILALINIFLDGLKAWSTIAESWMVLET